MYLETADCFFLSPFNPQSQVNLEALEGSTCEDRLALHKNLNPESATASSSAFACDNLVSRTSRVLEQVQDLDLNNLRLALDHLSLPTVWAPEQVPTPRVFGTRPTANGETGCLFHFHSSTTEHHFRGLTTSQLASSFQSVSDILGPVIPTTILLHPLQPT